MARSRNIKPGFFKNEILAKLTPLTRILFIGLWCIADRDGRLEDRPERIKIEVLPYDRCNVEKMLDELASSEEKFIERYTVKGKGYIQITNFQKHQSPHVKEQTNNYPAPYMSDAYTMQEQEITGQAEEKSPDSLNLIPDSLIEDVTEPGASTVQPTPKKKCLDYVYLTEEERDKLTGRMGEALAGAYIFKLNNYIGQLGEKKARSKYSSHYFVILNWFRRDAEEKKIKMGFGDFQQRDYTEEELEKLIDNR